MFSFRRKVSGASEDADSKRATVQSPANDEPLRFGLRNTRRSLGDRLRELVGITSVDEATLEEIESLLLMADVGVAATERLISALTQRLSRQQLADGDTLWRAVREELTAILEPVAQPLEIAAAQGRPFIILLVGVNGVGKTTTIGKLAQRFQSQGKKVMLAAGDTFRAAAVEQLQTWGERHDVAVISQQTGADSASVIYDAVAAATARNADILIADTAGRMHTKSNLMEELKKVKRVVRKLDPLAPHEIMLVVDAGTGQNAVAQAVQFNDAVGLTGVTLTKLDGTAKGGILFALANRIGVPIRYIGLGEKSEDLQEFSADQFVAALLD